MFAKENLDRKKKDINKIINSLKTNYTNGSRRNSSKSLTFFYSYLKRHNQCVKTNNTYSIFQVLILGGPQGPTLGSILSNIFINDLFYWVKISELHNFADENTISAAEFSIKRLLETLERERQIATDWLKQNNMVVNPDKFQAITVKKNSNMNNS